MSEKVSTPGRGREELRNWGSHLYNAGVVFFTTSHSAKGTCNFTRLSKRDLQLQKGLLHSRIVGCEQGGSRSECWGHQYIEEEDG